MTRFISLSGVTFTDSSLPVVESFPEKIKALSGLQSWVTAAADHVQMNSSNQIASLVDRSGNGNGFSQSTDGKKPLLVSGGLNGYPVARFNSASAQMMQYDGSYPAGDGQASVKLVLAKITTQGTTSNVLSSNSPSTGKHSLYLNSGGSLTMEGTSGKVSPLYAGGAGNKWILAIAEHDSANNIMRLNVNGADYSAEDSYYVINDTLYLGAGTASGTSAASMDVAEIMIFDETILDRADDLALIRRYFNSKYGLSV